MNVDREQLLELVARAGRMTDEALVASPNALMFQSIRRQLDAIGSDVARGGAFDPDIQRRVNIGLLAVREFEQTDPEYADLLERISFLYQDEGVLR